MSVTQLCDLIFNDPLNGFFFFFGSCIESWVLSLTCLNKWIWGCNIACHFSDWPAAVHPQHSSRRVHVILQCPSWSLFQVDGGLAAHALPEKGIGSEQKAKTAARPLPHPWSRPYCELLGDFLFLKWGSRRIRASPSTAVKVRKLRQHTPCSLGGPWAPAVVEAPVATWAFWFSSLPSWAGLDGIAVTRCEKCLTNPGWCIFVASSCYQIAG